MNLAFPALLVFLIFLPGFVFNLGFYNLTSQQLNYTSISHKILLNLTATVVIHTIGLLVAGCVSYFFGYSIKLNIILDLLAGVKEHLPNFSNAELILTVLYFIFVNALAYALGKSGGWVVKKQCWDDKVFQLNNRWYYLFQKNTLKEADGALISVLTEFAGKAYIYVGYLDKYFLNDATGNLELLVLKNVKRRLIENDGIDIKDEEKWFYSIVGDYCIFKDSEIQNLNVQFIKLEG